MMKNHYMDYMTKNIETVQIKHIFEYLKREKAIGAHINDDKAIPPKITIIHNKQEGKDIVLFGGMGYFATLDYLEQFLCFDISSIRTVYVLQATDIPDRTSAIEEMQSGCHTRARTLIAKIESYLNAISGLIDTEKADLVFLCNTVHVFLPYIHIDVSKFEVRSLIEATFQTVKTRNTGNILGLYTSGTKEVGLFKRIFNESLIELTQADTHVLMDIIYNGIKAGNMQYLSIKEAEINRMLNSYSFDAVLFGCTEIHSIFKHIKRHRLYVKIDPVLCVFEHILGQ
jgi:aspartate/glutamate racemase